MSYNYQTERARLLTPEGTPLLLEIRDKVRELLTTAGAFRLDKVLTGDSWQTIAAVEYLVERGELVELPRQCWAQYRVFASPEVHNR